MAVCVARRVDYVDIGMAPLRVNGTLIIVVQSSWAYIYRIRVLVLLKRIGKANHYSRGLHGCTFLWPSAHSHGII